MKDSNILYLVVSKFSEVDLHPGRCDNEEMGLVFENLIRRFMNQPMRPPGTTSPRVRSSA
jgi:hypothetical protein